jgi:hypothetical protein
MIANYLWRGQVAASGSSKMGDWRWKQIFLCYVKTDPIGLEIMLMDSPCKIPSQENTSLKKILDRQLASSMCMKESSALVVKNFWLF